jgi:hypothetical protein
MPFTNRNPPQTGLIECGWRSATTNSSVVAVTAMTAALNPTNAAKCRRSTPRCSRLTMKPQIISPTMTRVTGSKMFIHNICPCWNASERMTPAKKLRGGTFFHPASKPRETFRATSLQRRGRGRPRPTAKPHRLATPNPDPAWHWRPSGSRRCWRRSPDCPGCRISRLSRSSSCGWRS